jgi:uncharacterized membrane protein YraQ (UPF0718 family)
MEHHHHQEKEEKCDSCEVNVKGKKIDYLLWGTSIVLVIAYLAYFMFREQVVEIQYVNTFGASVFELINRMSWGLAIGIIFVGLIEKAPQSLIKKLMGKGGTFSGLVRATLAGVLLDLCSHGILLVGMQLYKKGLSLGQTMAFLIASPWNSISLTLVLWALVGFKWMISFLLLSLVIAIVSGMIFNSLTKRGILPENPHAKDDEVKDHWKSELKAVFFENLKAKNIWMIPKNGLLGSKMILRWIFLGVVIAALIRTFVSPDQFQTLFGPSLAGLGLTLVVATILEVCSEGSTPIAADILTRANAPGNAFAFLMTGVSTDYTEILSLREATKSWKMAFFLPLVTLPQVIILALILNRMIF